MQLERVVRSGTPPLQLTSFVGRTHELAALTQLLRNPDVRLVTITGPGGSGKTRLALQGAAAVAEDFPDGCLFVDLAPLHSPDQVPCALACALDVPEPSDQIGVSALLVLLRWKRMLLVVDNCEHLPGVADFFSDILGNAGTVTLLATSRVALGIYGEHEVPIGSLDVPVPHADDPGVLLCASAVQLFVQRAELVRPGLIRPDMHAVMIAEICRRLDGLPLAIELAAARIKLFPPAALLEHMDRTGVLHTLIGGPRNMPTRHQTLQATIAWSHDLLHPDEQLLFRLMAVFVGTFDAEAATAVCGFGDLTADRVPELLAALVEQNLVYVIDTATSTQTFGLLETIRAYALERLAESNEAIVVRAAHLNYYAGLAWASELGLYGPGRLRWLARLDTAYPNIRAALLWGLVAQGDRAAGLRLAATLWSYWRARSLFGETYHCLHSAGLRDSLAPAGLRARVLVGIAWVIDRQSNMDRAIELAHEALRLAEHSGDQTTQLSALTIIALDDRDPHAAAAVRQRCLAFAEHESNPWIRYHVLLRCAWPAPDAEAARWDAFWADLDRYATASGDPWLHSDLLLNQFYVLLPGRDRGALRRLLVEHAAVAQLIGSLQAIALTEEFSARLAATEGRCDDALLHQQARLDAERTLGNVSGIANALLEIATIHTDRAELDEAERQSREALELLRPIDDYQGMCFGLIVSAWICLWRADLTAAVHHCEIGLDLLKRIKRRSVYEHLTGQFMIVRGLAAFADERFELAAEQFRIGLPEDPSADRVNDAFARFGLGLLSAQRGDYATAFTLIDPIVEFLRLQDPRTLVIALWGLAPIKLAAGAVAEARALCLEGLSLVAHTKMRVWGLQLMDRFAAISAQQGDLPAAVRWWALVDQQRATPGIQIWPSNRNVYEQRLAQARVMLGEELFQAAWRAGWQLDWEAELAAVLAVPDHVVQAPANDTRQELAMAAEIQTGLLPKNLPQPPGWHVAATLVPARETAGDFYDCMLLPDGRLVLVIADVAGKGLGPALYMATARALIRMLVASVTVEPRDVLASVNMRLLDDTHTSLFMTAFYGVLDPIQGILTYANAGHPPPLLLHPGDPAVRALMPTGMVLGIETQARWHQESVALPPGSLLMLYTDGITEAQNLRRELFEDDRLCDLLQSHMPLTAEQAVAVVLDGVHRFVGAAPQADDITLLAVEWSADAQMG